MLALRYAGGAEGWRSQRRIIDKPRIMGGCSLEHGAVSDTAALIKLYRREGRGGGDAAPFLMSSATYCWPNRLGHDCLPPAGFMAAQTQPAKRAEAV